MAADPICVQCPEMRTILSPRLARGVAAALSELATPTAMTAAEQLANGVPGDVVELDGCVACEFRQAIRIAMAAA